MKKAIAILLSLLLMATTGAALAEAVKIAATSTPHGIILEHIKPLMAEKGFELEITIFEDYIMPNDVVEQGEMDANFFQHTNYLYEFNAERGSHLVPVIPVHFEPMAMYKGKTDSLDALADGAVIGVPNDTTNETRALKLLQTMGLIEIDESAGIKATKLDITVNEKNLVIQEIEAAQLPRMLQDLDFAVINGNYALAADLSLLDDTVGMEGGEGSDPSAYSGVVNYIVVKEGNEDAPFVAALREALNDPDTVQFMQDTFKDSIVLALDAEIPPVPEAE